MPDHSDAFMMSVIDLINASRHAFRSMVGSGLRSHDLLGYNMIIFLTSAIVVALKDVS